MEGASSCRGADAPWSPNSTGELFCDDAGVVTAESKGVVDDARDFALPRLVGNVVQIAFRIRCLEVDGRGHDIGLNRFGANQHLYGAGGTQHVAGSSFS